MPHLQIFWVHKCYLDPSNLKKLNNIKNITQKINYSLPTMSNVMLSIPSYSIYKNINLKFKLPRIITIAIMSPNFNCLIIRTASQINIAIECN